jgi:hypothetical protein
MQDLIEKGQASRFSDEYFNRYKGTEYSLRVVIWRGEEYIAGFVSSYPDACPSDESRGYILYPMRKAVGELAMFRERVQQWKCDNPGRASFLGPPCWSILDKAEYGEEAERRYREAMMEVEISDLQRSPALQQKYKQKYNEENDPTRLFCAWSSSNGVGPGYLESLLQQERLLTAAGIDHAPLTPYRTPEDFLHLGKDAVRAMVNMVRIQNCVNEVEIQRIFENRWKTLEYVAERRAKAKATA